MPTLEIEVTLRLNGKLLDGFPLIHRRTVNEFQLLQVIKANDGVGVYATIPTLNALSEIDALLLSPDTAMGILFNGNSGTGFTIQPGGMVLLFDVVVNSGASTNVKVNNNSGGNLNVTGFAAGP